VAAWRVIGHPGVPFPAPALHSNSLAPAGVTLGQHYSQILLADPTAGCGHSHGQASVQGRAIRLRWREEVYVRLAFGLGCGRFARVRRTLWQRSG
jgi:hypothetical protein